METLIIDRKQNRIAEALEDAARENDGDARHQDTEINAAAYVYAETVLEIPEIEEYYTAIAEIDLEGNAFAAAVFDFIDLPGFSDVDPYGYQGRVGNTIRIEPNHNYKFMELHVHILQPDGTLVESGKAQHRNLKWYYEAKAINNEVEDSRICLTAYDHLSRSAKLEIVL